MAVKKKPKLDPQTVDLEEMIQDAAKQQANQAAQFSLDDLKAYGAELEELRAKADEASKLLASYGEKIRILETETLPDMLKNLGIKDFTLMSGAKIALYDIISASITDENREEAHAWLRAHNHGDIIKNNLTLTFGKGEDEIAKNLTTYLLRMRSEGDTKFGDMQLKEAVHPQTLKAFVKGQLTEGKEFPGQLFKLYIGQAVQFKK